jgi:Na+-transporting NADH:ubiquinone oxidoreductase subunit C
MAEPGRLRRGVTTVLFMLVITFVFISALTLVNLFTRERVERNRRLFLQRAVLVSAGVELPADDAATAAFFERSVREVRDEEGALRYYEVRPPGRSEPTGDVVIRSGPGLWGQIQASIGYDPGSGRLTGIDFIAQNETPGLGARISESWFKEQFRGKRGPFRLVPEGQAAGEDEFQAITGATSTSNAVLDLINRSIREDVPRIEAGKGVTP